MAARSPRPIRAALIAVTGAALGVSALLAAPPARAATLPDSISAVTVQAATAGTFTVSWTQGGHNTTGFELETGLNPFSKTNTTMPSTGRHAHVFTIARTARSFTFHSAELSAAGAPLSSGNVVYFRLTAVNTVGTSTARRAYGYLQAGMPKVPTYTAAGVTVGSFNVLTASAPAPAKPWSTRVATVARQIIYYHPGVVALQELNVGRADGKSGWNDGTPRQDESLVTQLAAFGAGRYRLVRTTPYTNPDDHVDTQGERILYDSSKYTLGSVCSNTTGSHAYSSSCSIRLPLRSSDPTTLTRFAGYAWFTDKANGKKFYRRLGPPGQAAHRDGGRPGLVRQTAPDPDGHGHGVHRQDQHQPPAGHHLRGHELLAERPLRRLGPRQPGQCRLHRQLRRDQADPRVSTAPIPTMRSR